MMWRLLLVLGAALTLAACGVAPPSPEGIDGARPIARWDAPPAPETWSLTGRAAVRTPEQAGTVSVHWRHDDAGYRIDLRAPLGAGALRLVGDDQGVLLRTAGGEQYRADSARALLQAAAGYDLPVDYLRWWLRGQPVPGLPGEVITDAEGRAAVLRQDGWRVLLSDYREVAGYHLPHRVSAEKEPVSARIAIREWSVPQ
jgi:outer membrane lipoprotein LolB